MGLARFLLYCIDSVLFLHFVLNIKLHVTEVLSSFLMSFIWFTRPISALFPDCIKVCYVLPLLISSPVCHCAFLLFSPFSFTLFPSVSAVFLPAHLLYHGLWSLAIFASSLFDLFGVLDCCPVLTLTIFTFLKPYVVVYLINILTGKSLF